MHVITYIKIVFQYNVLAQACSRKSIELDRYVKQSNGYNN